jgi:hypothetical protein
MKIAPNTNIPISHTCTVRQVFWTTTGGTGHTGYGASEHLEGQAAGLLLAGIGLAEESLSMMALWYMDISSMMNMV